MMMMMMIMIMMIIIIIMPPHLCTGKGYYSINKWQWKLQMGNTKSKNEYKRVQTGTRRELSSLAEI